MITRIDPPLPVFTPKGNGLAHFIIDYGYNIDYGYETDLMWIVFSDLGGECGTYKSIDIRLRNNSTQRRGCPSPFYDPDDFSLKGLKPYDWGQR